MAQKRGLVEVRLDRRQAFYSVVGLMLIVSVAFVVGVIVGQRMQPPGDVPSLALSGDAGDGVETHLAAPNQAAAAVDHIDETEPPDRYTFYDELGEESPRPSAQLLPPGYEVGEPAAVIRALEREADHLAAVDEAPDREPEVDENPGASSELPAEPAEAAPTTAESDALVAEAETVVALIDQPSRAVPETQTRRAIRRIRGDAGERSSAADEPAVQRRTNGAPEDFGFYTVDAGQFGSFGEASTLRNQLREAGHEAIVTIISDANSRSYRVQVGSFTRRVDASEIAGSLEGGGFSAQVVQEG